MDPIGGMDPFLIEFNERVARFDALLNPERFIPPLLWLEEWQPIQYILSMGDISFLYEIVLLQLTLMFVLSTVVGVASFLQEKRKLITSDRESIFFMV